MTIQLNALIIAAGAALLTACGGNDASNENVAVAFSPKVAGQDFACNAVYTGMGNGEQTDFEARDFRWYASNFRLRTAAREEVPVTLEGRGDGLQFQDQDRNVALLGAVNGCDSGQATQLNLLVTGTAPAGEYAQLCFELGVPFELNHSDPTANGTPSPLNVPAMNWFWRGGRKFLKIDGIGDPDGAAQAFNFHLGSTGCSNDAGTDGQMNGRERGPSGPCTQPNTPEYCVDYAALSNGAAISVDPARIATNTDIGHNTPDTAPGCMAFINDPECADIMPKLGLDYPINGETMPAQTPALFQLEI